MVMISVEEFRELLQSKSAYEIVNDYLICESAAHVSDVNIEYIREIISLSYNVDPKDVEVIITGSAKLGFSLCEKTKNEKTLPRYRLFSADSDIDVAVISPAIFNKIWLELSGHFHRTTWFPKNAGRLGDYLMIGWLRPDHFPRGVRLPLCDNWWETFRKLTRDPVFGRRRISGGAFQSRAHLVQYLERSVNNCYEEEIKS